MLELNKVYQGDCLEVMKNLPDESVDLIVTDSPYGYFFMGKDWDKAVPSVAVWRECLRVLKAGAFAFVMSSPRQDVLSQMIMRLAEAGFNTGFTSLYWTYSSGFPKAGNIGKIAMKKLGDKGTIIGREKVDIGIQGGSMHAGRSSKIVERDILKPSIPETKIFEGSFAGFQPKPAVEVVIVVMKPLSEKTYVEQALKNGKGITWMDDGRIPYKTEVDKQNAESLGASFAGKSYDTGRYNFNVDNSFIRNDFDAKDGRFPANLLVEDDVLNNGTTYKSVASVRHNKSSMGIIGNRNSTIGVGDVFSPYSDSGGFSRYFSLDAWWDKRIEKLPKEVLEVFPFLIVPKASKSEKNKGLNFNPISNTDRYNGKFPDTKTDKNNLNKHPTVKPLKLFSYLITIGSREHDLVLDPFCGSGTIGVASRIASRNFIGIELQEEYCKIANARIAPQMAQRKLYEI